MYDLVTSAASRVGDVAASAADQISEKAFDLVGTAGSLLESPEPDHDRLEWLADVIKKQRAQIDANRAELARRGIDLDMSKVHAKRPPPPQKFPDWVETFVEPEWNWPPMTGADKFGAASAHACS